MVYVTPLLLRTAKRYENYPTYPKQKNDHQKR